jgi:hypothetical protein
MSVNPFDFAIPHGDLSRLSQIERERAEFLVVKHLPARIWGQGIGSGSEMAVPLGPESSPAWLIYKEGRAWTVLKQGWRPYEHQRKISWSVVRREGGWPTACCGISQH